MTGHPDCDFCGGSGGLCCSGRPILPANPTDTQAQAAASLDPSLLRAQTAGMLEVLCISGGGLTDDAIYVAMTEHGIDISTNGHRARRQELERLGYVRETERRAPTRTGRNAIVWEVTEAGRRALQEYQTTFAA